MLIDDFSVQRALAAKGLYKGVIDGKFGTQSVAALNAAGYSTAWPLERKRIAFEQRMLADLGFYKSAVDGIAGPATQAAVEKWQDYLTFKRKPLPAKEVAYQPAQFPRQADVRKFYGEPGENQTMLVSPYPLYLDWSLSTKVGKFSIHEKCHDAALWAMNAVLSEYGEAEIHRLGLDQFGGCLNVRKMRNGRTLSMHSWGIAIDWDADRNPLRATSRTALMATAPYAKFLDLWEEAGFISLGRLRTFDWMHVQAARL
jgi:hypothetical protein